MNKKLKDLKPQINFGRPSFRLRGLSVALRWKSHEFRMIVHFNIVLRRGAWNDDGAKTWGFSIGRLFK